MQFSVIIPLFNKQSHIQRAINSVLAQTCQDFELIIVDDGSTDESYSRAAEVQDARIRIVQQANRGVSAARNRGVAEAQSDWVAFLDADDEWLPEFLQRMNHIITKYPGCGVYGCPAYTFDGNNTYLFITSIRGFPIGWQGVFDNYFDYVNEKLPYNASSIVIQKTKFLEVGGFPIGVKYLEDTELTTKLALLYPAAYLNLPLVVYHLESENRSKPILIDLESLINKWREFQIHNMIPEENLSAFEEFITRYRIRAIRNYLRDGNFYSAQETLNQIGISKRYGAKVESLRRRSRRPKIVDKLLLRTRAMAMQIYVRLTAYLGLD